MSHLLNGALSARVLFVSHITKSVLDANQIFHTHVTDLHPAFDTVQLSCTAPSLTADRWLLFPILYRFQRHILFSKRRLRAASTAGSSSSAQSATSYSKHPTRSPPAHEKGHASALTLHHSCNLRATSSPSTQGFVTAHPLPSEPSRNEIWGEASARRLARRPSTMQRFQVRPPSPLDVDCV